MDTDGNIAVKTEIADGAPCPSHWLTPLKNKSSKEKSRKLLFYVHGGSFTLGASPLVTNMICDLAERVGFQVLMPAYRLAPEHPCPAAIHDIIAVYEWLLQNGQNPKDIIFCGEQIGAAILLAALQQYRDKALPMPAATILFSPLVDLSLDSWSLVLRGLSSRKHSGELLSLAIKMYLGVFEKSLQANDPLVSPIFGEMHGLPPTQINGYDDVFILENSSRLNRVLTDADTVSSINIWPDPSRVWQRYIPDNYRPLVEKSAAFIELFCDV